MTHKIMTETKTSLETKQRDCIDFPLLVITAVSIGQVSTTRNE